MKERILAGAAAALAVVLLPMGLLGMGRRETAEVSRETAAEASQAAQVSPAAAEPVGRRVRAIVVHEAAGAADFDESLSVTVEVAGVCREMTLADYLWGVLAGEMPAEFPLEALKAQAVAARTYTLRRLEQGGALSDDPAVCQAYVSPEQAEARWGDRWEEYRDKLRQAVSETNGQVMTYQGALISATYFSCSGGRTESAQAVWGGEVPYLVSVESPGEEGAAGFESSVTLTLSEFLETLDIQEPWVSQVQYTQGGGVDTMVIGGRTFTGTELRELLGLRSTRFTMELSADTVTFSVLGYGHRVGMSQYGARAMAEAGKTYRDILTWYYTGAELTDWA